MKSPFLPGAVLVLCSTLATPAATQTVPAARPRPTASAWASPAPNLALYSPRVRRLVQAYLRLRLLEARETELERARAVIERKLGVDALLRDETPPRRAR